MTRTVRTTAGTGLSGQMFVARSWSSGQPHKGPTCGFNSAGRPSRIEVLHDVARRQAEIEGGCTRTVKPSALPAAKGADEAIHDWFL